MKRGTAEAGEALVGILAQRVAQEIDAKNLTQSELARLAGVDRKTVHAIIHGKNACSVYAIGRIAAALEISPDALLRVPSHYETKTRQAEELREIMVRLYRQKEATR